MADQGRWFKLWVSAAYDPDLSNLELADFARWCLFGVYLKSHGKNGSIDIKEPAFALQQLLRVQTFKDVILCIRKFPNCTVGEKQNETVTSVTNATVTWRNWLKYQGDFSGDRVAKFRSVKRTKKRGEEKRGEETKKRREPTLSHLSLPEFLNHLKSKPAYQGIDLENEWSKCETWSETKGYKISYRRFVNWINRAEKPIVNLKPLRQASQPYKPPDRTDDPVPPEEISEFVSALAGKKGME